MKIPKIPGLFLKERDGGKPDFRLLDGEKIEKRLTPHILAFYSLYAIWILLMTISALFIFYGDDLAEFFEYPLRGVAGMLMPFSGRSNLITDQVPMLRDVNAIIGMFFGQATGTITSGEYLPVLLWITFLFLFSMVVSVLRISWRWILIMLGVGLLSVGIVLALGLPSEATYFISMILSLLGIMGVELFRRAHKFYITNFRIVTKLKFFGYRENALSYDKINNMIMDQSMFGRIFDFGTLIPVTASGLGMGEDFAAVGVGIARQWGEGPVMAGGVMGGRSVGVPRTRSAYALFGISKPHDVYHLISKFVQEYVEAPYLKEMTADLRELRKGLTKGKKKERYSKDDPLT